MYDRGECTLFNINELALLVHHLVLFTYKLISLQTHCLLNSAWTNQPIFTKFTPHTWSQKDACSIWITLTLVWDKLLLNMNELDRQGYLVLLLIGTSIMKSLVCTMTFEYISPVSPHLYQLCLVVQWRSLFSVNDLDYDLQVHLVFPVISTPLSDRVLGSPHNIGTNWSSFIVFAPDTYHSALKIPILIGSSFSSSLSTLSAMWDTHVMCVG